MEIAVLFEGEDAWLTTEEKEMFDKFSKPSPALVLAFVALFVALVGGAYAAKVVKKNRLLPRASGPTP